MDPTEEQRRSASRVINESPASRDVLAARHGDVWDTTELREWFEVVGFLAPLVIVHRKSDGMTGTVQFQHSPRFYFQFRPCDDP